MPEPIITTDAAERKNVPLASGLFDYFPAALVAVAALSAKGNQQHHAGKPLHWDRSKSSDHADALLRHLLDRGIKDSDGVLHSAKVAWRALALLQEELESIGAAPIARGARNAGDDDEPLPVKGPEKGPSNPPLSARAIPVTGRRNYNDAIAEAIAEFGRKECV
jgi:hypothetical protein